MHLHRSAKAQARKGMIGHIFIDMHIHIHIHIFVYLYVYIYFVLPAKASIASNDLCMCVAHLAQAIILCVYHPAKDW